MVCVRTASGVKRSVPFDTLLYPAPCPAPCLAPCLALPYSALLPALLCPLPYSAVLTALPCSLPYSALIAALPCEKLSLELIPVCL